jgi:RNA polymerase sigma-70 factor (ECF subfamily)
MGEMAELSCGDLVRRTLGGEREAYGELVARYQGHVYGLAYSLVGDWASAQDVAQETFIRAYCNLEQLREPEKFPAWLRRVTFGVAMNWLKAFRPGMFKQMDGQVDLDALEVPDFHPGPAEVTEKRELAEAVLKAVASLPPRYRLPLTMFHLDGLSYQKVADFLDIPLGTAKSLIHRAQEKLRAALPAALVKEMTMVQEVFDEHKLPAAFASKVLDKVPMLRWGSGKECTFAGALEAALSVTEHPYTYTDLMGFTGLAFRVRWFKPATPGVPAWCNSCAVGEMEEEVESAQRATGWKIAVDVHFGDPQMERFAPALAASIDAGKPVVAYADMWDMAVIYGYSEGGRKLLFRDYWGKDDFKELPLSKITGLWFTLQEHVEPPAQRDSVGDALKMAAHHWRRVSAKAGPGEYWYGDAAWERWLNDVGLAGAFTAEQRAKLFCCSRWVFLTLFDARKEAAAFLRENAPLLPSAAQPAAQRAAEIYDQQVRFMTSHPSRIMPGGDAKDWAPEVRARQIEFLAEVRRLDAAAVAEIEKSVAALGSPNSA